jgi:hypothetical protein
MEDPKSPHQSARDAPHTASGVKPEKPVRQVYRPPLTAAEEVEFEALRNIQGIDDEITLLRVNLRKILRRQPNNARLLTHTIRTLALLVKIRHDMTDKKSNNLKEAINGVFKELAGPLGVNIGTELGKRIIK